MGVYLNERHAVFFAFFSHGIRPNACLCFADVSLVEKDHAESALSDASSNTLGKGSFEESAMEKEILAFFLSLDGQLSV